MAAGLMRPSGLAAVEAARANGKWAALDHVEQLTEPDKLSRALDASPAARASWNGFPRSAKRAIRSGSGTPGNGDADGADRRKPCQKPRPGGGLTSGGSRRVRQRMAHSRQGTAGTAGMTVEPVRSAAAKGWDGAGAPGGASQGQSPARGAPDPAPLDLRTA